jgi:hypothetical protein
VLTVAFIMKKYIKKHLKDEKRILKLMYKKGIFELLHIDLNDLSWEILLDGKRQRKRKGKWGYRDFLPELHVWSQDYWGEGDSRSVVDYFKSYYWFEFATEREEDGYPISHKYPTTKFLIEYLIKLPTKNSNSKFNKFLILNDE